MANKVHIIPHVHWDQEWYFTEEESRILLVNDMEEILEMLEKNEGYPYFLLDGQAAILEDYVSLVPENKQRIKKLVAAGRLGIGPWFTQTDEMVVGQESIVRNLLYGNKICREYGEMMAIGYLPDSFGQSAQLPMILNGFGIKRCIFWRGVSERVGTDKTEFIWQGNNDEEVVTQILPLGYAIGKYLPAEPKGLKQRMDKYLPVLDRGAVTDHIILPNGHDQMPVQKNIFEVMESLHECYPEREFFLSRYERVFEELEKEQLPKLQGEFIDGKYMRVHRSIYSSRSDLKAMNTRIENKVTHLLEPLASLGYHLGIPYHHGLIDGIWKNLLKNHAHDSIGCCCSDKVHQMIENRFCLAEERTDQMIQYYMRKITDAVDATISTEKLTVFNLLPYNRNGVIEAEIITRQPAFLLLDEEQQEIAYEVVTATEIDPGLIDRQIVHYGNYDPFVRYQIAFKAEIPAVGYQTFFIAGDEGGAMKTETIDKETIAGNQQALENQYYHIEIKPNGTLTITDKLTGLQYENLLMVEDGGDDGDGYDYSPPMKDVICTSKEVKADITVSYYRFYQEARISYQMVVPKNLESRTAGFLDSSIMVSLQLKLYQDSPVLDIKATFDNHSEDHRIRLLFPQQGASQASICDNQFGQIIRGARDEALDIWEAEHWSERPDGIYPFLSYVTSNREDGVGILTNSVREYELIGENYDILAITMMRSTGLLGKENLVRRPGRPSGIRMETPASQMKGTYCYHLGLCFKADGMGRLAREFQTPLVSYNKKAHDAMKMNQLTFQLPASYKMMAETGQKTIMAALKKAEDEDGLIVRFYNECQETQFVQLQSPYQTVGETDLGEKPLATSNWAVKHNQVKTFILRDKA